MLDGITVLDLASVGPAARASRWLGDYGATVVKVGPVPTQEGLQLVPPFHAYSANRGVKRIMIDLKHPDGRTAFLRLASTADVVIESFRPGVVDRLGIGYEDVCAENPGVVYCSTTGYGQVGPHAQWAGHDLNYLAVSGFLECCGRDDEGRPPLPGATIADSAGGGMHAVIAILAALVRRGATGRGARLDVSVANGMLSLMALQIDEYLAAGTVPGPGHALLSGRFACYGIYGTQDDKWLAVAAIEPRFWANLCTALGVAKWIEHQNDDAVQDAIRADLEGTFRGRTRDAWVAELAGADTCVAPVLSIPEVARDAELVVARHPTQGDFQQLGAVLAGMDPVGYEVADATDANTDELLLGAGVTKDELAGLHHLGVVA